jgi:DNA (cytosine-5)-methyltransferase 1
MTDTRPVAIDFFCCQGGASKGLHDAGFRVIGVDKDPQPRYPFEFIQADAITDFRDIVRKYRSQLVTGSPPCQAYTDAQVIQGRAHPRLIAPFRDLCLSWGGPFVIENVEGARPEMLNPVMLCGYGWPFNLKTDRHRLFETGGGFSIASPRHNDHSGIPKTKMGRPFVDGELRQYIGNFHGPDAARDDLDVPWMSRDGIRECIPPVYGLWIGVQARAHLERIIV